jgi:hypothetical protein
VTEQSPEKIDGNYIMRLRYGTMMHFSVFTCRNRCDPHDIKPKKKKTKKNRKKPPHLTAIVLATSAKHRSMYATLHMNFRCILLEIHMKFTRNSCENYNISTWNSSKKIFIWIHIWYPFHMNFTWKVLHHVIHMNITWNSLEAYFSTSIKSKLFGVTQITNSCILKSACDVILLFERSIIVQEWTVQLNKWITQYSAYFSYFIPCYPQPIWNWTIVYRKIVSYNRSLTHTFKTTNCALLSELLGQLKEIEKKKLKSLS